MKERRPATGSLTIINFLIQKMAGKMLGSIKTMAKKFGSILETREFFVNYRE